MKEAELGKLGYSTEAANILLEYFRDTLRIKTWKEFADARDIESFKSP